DDSPVGSWSKALWEQGVNLAMLDTPMAKQAAEVHALTLKHNNIHFTRWRQLQVPLEADRLASTQEAIAALDKLELELIQRQRSAAQPKPRRYQLVAEP
ncbi:MAG: GDSL family lipase, partial [Bryobacteraceae bacterium]